MKEEYDLMLKCLNDIKIDSKFTRVNMYKEYIVF